jgi:hypothetical protein
MQLVVVETCFAIVNGNPTRCGSGKLKNRRRIKVQHTSHRNHTERVTMTSSLILT